MKKIVPFLAGLLLPGLLSLEAAPSSSTATVSAVDTIKIITTPGLTSLVQSWINGYTIKNRESVFSVMASVNDVTAQAKSLGFLPAESQLIRSNGYGWKLIVAHDAVVPVFSSLNPLRNELSARGISPSAFARILKGSGKIFWSELIPGAPQKPINIYLPDNGSIYHSVEGFTGISDLSILNIRGVKEDKFVEALKSDIWSVGFCKLNDIASGSLMQGDLTILPVDRNGNGRIDSFEKIYDNPESLLRGVWTGKYPRSLCGSIYAVSTVKPVDKSAIAFLRWIITEGDQKLSSNGFSQLAGTEKASGLAYIADSKNSIVNPAGDLVSNSWLFILAGIIITGVIITAVRTFRRRKDSVLSSLPAKEIRVLSEKTITSPAGLYYDKSHTWAFMERDGLVRIGVDDFLQHVTGTITGIRLIETGEYVKRGEKILTLVRDGKQLSLYSPVSGIVRSQNTDLYLDSSLINSSPYTDGWIYLVEPRNWIKDIQIMFLTDRFREWLNSEFSRLKDFLAAALTSHYAEYAAIVLQDGGELADNILEKLGPEVWEDFQANFIDKSR